MSTRQRPIRQSNSFNRQKDSNISRPQQSAIATPDGLAAREAAVYLLREVVERRHALDDALAKSYADPRWSALAPRDRAFARLIAATVLRQMGSLDAVLNSFLEKPLPERRGGLKPILLSAAAQLLYLGTPPHAAISLAVDQCRRDRAASRFCGLANAVLRRVSEKGPEILASIDTGRVNIPNWIWQRWADAYGESTARQIAIASLSEAPLDLSVKSDAAGWAERLGGTVLPTGNVRLIAGGRIEELPGYADGEWWVQDAGAALPVRLLGGVSGLAVADLCAAPGGKTAELAALGARVTAVDVSAKRLERVPENLARLKLDAELVAADILQWSPERLFDAVLLDAPCTATGTIRRHPDILQLKRPEDVARLAALQSRLLERAITYVKPGGIVVYCTCSLEPEEGPEQVAALLSRTPNVTRVPIGAGEIHAEENWITPDGDLRTLPFHMQHKSPGLSGMDGFYAARLRRTA